MGKEILFNLRRGDHGGWICRALPERPGPWKEAQGATPLQALANLWDNLAASVVDAQPPELVGAGA